jgi:hypothetical protein
MLSSLFFGNLALFLKYIFTAALIGLPLLTNSQSTFLGVVISNEDNIPPSAITIKVNGPYRVATTDLVGNHKLGTGQNGPDLRVRFIGSMNNTNNQNLK